MQDYTDQELLEMYRDEPSRNMSVHFMIKKYQQRLYWHIRKIIIDHDDTDDVLQNTFIKAWKGMATFKEDSKLYTWLYRIATNESISFLRKKKQANLTSIHTLEDQLSKNLESDSYFKGDEIQMKLQKAILTLPEKQRIVFNMRYYDETPYDEMAEILETSASALRASYHLAAKKVEEYLKNS
ncbi:MAG: polymerase sigma70 factor [Bacteroidetes bacterium]|nr:polymerase sigma70 factor [Bacteroidota bacterium]